jgi:DNA ligase 1
MNRCLFRLPGLVPYPELTLRYVLSVRIEPEHLIEVLANEITRSPVHMAGNVGDEPGYALRFPRLVSFRDKDKRPEDATTVQKLIEM